MSVRLAIAPSFSGSIVNPDPCPEHRVVVAYDSLDAAVAHVVDLARGGHVDFILYEIGPREDQIYVAVDRLSRTAAAHFFRERDLRWPDGSEMTVEIDVLAAAGWISEPSRRSSEQPDPAALQGLVGLDVNAAALQANAGRWIVRAFEHQAVLSADLRSNRANLLFDESGRVLRVTVG